MTEIALSIALAAVLHLLSAQLGLQMPFGGSLSLSMLPIMVIALRRGLVVGVITGMLFGVIDYFMEPVFVHWAQFLLDYTVAFGLVGLAGLTRPVAAASFRQGRPGRAVWAAIVPGCLIGGVARFSAHLVSGAIFFASYAPVGQNAWVYSLLYNGGYMLPSTIACLIAAIALLPALERAVPVALTA
jgi:thiamine transporter